ncbi:hypothetical protein QTP88_015108 [Uroleucon formosanum]
MPVVATNANPIVEPEMLQVPNSYTTVFGVQRSTEIIKSNVGFLYYKNKSTETKIFPDGAQQYTFLQSDERMRRLRRQCFPATPRNLAELHYLLVADENKEYTQTLQSPPNGFYQGPLLIQGFMQGIIFYNLVNIQQIENELRNICTTGCDGTFKTLHTFLNKDAAYQIFSIHVIFKNVSYPLVHAILSSKSQEIYTELLRYVRTYLTIITDFEYGLINVMNNIFPESKYQGCYFHFCQAVIRFTKNKRTLLFNLIKTNANAARILGMILALPYFPTTAINVIPSMEDGFHAIIEYINQFPELANMIPFLNNYIWGYWFVTIGPAAVTFCPFCVGRSICYVSITISGKPKLYRISPVS